MRASPYGIVMTANIVTLFWRTGVKRWSSAFWLELLFTAVISIVMVWALEWVAKKFGWNRE